MVVRLPGNMFGFTFFPWKSSSRFDIFQAEHFSPQKTTGKKPERGTRKPPLAGNQLFGSMKVPASPIPGEGGCRENFFSMSLWMGWKWSDQRWSDQWVIVHPNILPRKLTWNQKMEVWKMIFLFKQWIFRFHVSFRGCTPFISRL